MNARDYTLSVLEFTRWYTHNLLKDIPQDKWTHQPSPTDNHILWCLGHIAGTDAWIGATLGVAGVHVPENIQKAFGMGTTPSQTGNPAAADVLAALEQSRAKIVAWLKDAPESALKIDLNEKTGAFAKDPIDALIKIAWHEGFHAGQIANIRKSLGMPRTM